MSYLIAFVSLGFLITVHEMGHFLAAGLAGVPIKRFSVGFGPRVWGFMWKRTELRLSLIPLGGYVLPAIEDENDYFSLSYGKRMAFLLGGPLANLGLALPLFALLNVVNEQGDAHSFLAAPFQQVFHAFAQTFVALPILLANPGAVSSVVGIVSYGGAAVQAGFVGAITFAAAMSVNLAAFNLLPLPPLDGGKIALDTIERLQPKLARAYLPLCALGWVFLIGVMFYATANDIHRLTADAAMAV